MRLTKLIGASIQYCGHEAVFAADIYPIGTAVVVRAQGPITPALLDRSPAMYAAADYRITDTPKTGFWRPDLGVFVVPKAQLQKPLKLK